MKKLTLLSTTLLLSSCASLNDSLTLGGGLGAGAGAAATYIGTQASGKNPSFENVAIGAGIGLGVGLLTSYFTHKEVDKKRDLKGPETDMYFGDLPPSPFIMPMINPKKRGN